MSVERFLNVSTGNQRSNFRKWQNIESHKEFFERLSKKLGHKSKDDWYTTSLSDVQESGGSGLLEYYYGQSIPKALKTLFPEHKWIPWKFKRVPNHGWDNYVD